jgi:hypothetical protein
MVPISTDNLSQGRSRGEVQAQSRRTIQVSLQVSLLGITLVLFYLYFALSWWQA